MGLEIVGLPSPNYSMTTVQGVASLLLAMGLVGLATWFAAKAVLRKDDVNTALAAGAFGLIAAHLAFILANIPIVGLILGLAAFSLVTALLYRAKPAQGFVLGAVAWVLWILVEIAIRYVQDHWKA